MFSIAFDSRSLREIAMFYGFETLLQPEVQEALREIETWLVEDAQANTWQVFEHPSGGLASSIHALPVSNFEAMIGSDDPKAHRREVGFSGMTDALGRYYPYDPGKPYMEPAIAHVEQRALLRMEQAVEKAWNRIATG